LPGVRLGSSYPVEDVDGDDSIFLGGRPFSSVLTVLSGHKAGVVGFLWLFVGAADVLQGKGRNHGDFLLSGLFSLDKGIFLRGSLVVFLDLADLLVPLFVVIDSVSAEAASYLVFNHGGLVLGGGLLVGRSLIRQVVGMEVAGV